MLLKFKNVRVGVLCLLSLAGILACDKEDDPSAIDVKNLKYPSTLTIVDNGNGSVRLSWIASNFEGDFQGFNVYGVKMSDDGIADLAKQGLVKGTPIELLNADGDARDEAKEILEKFNYNTDKPLEEAKKSEPSDDSERKFSYLPIHSLDKNKKPILPTCYPSASDDGYECTAYTADNAAKVKKAGKISANGSVYYDISGLTLGEQYCFIIFSTQDDGKEISRTSSNFECVTPTYQADVDFDATKTFLEFKAREYAQACSKTCPTLDDTYIVTSSAATEASTGVVYLETYSSKKYLTAGANCGILDMGVRTGLTDSTLPSAFPTFSNEVGAGAALNANGYSPAGASILLLPKHAYIVACDDTEDTKKSFYHWLFLNSDATPTTTGTIPMHIRVGINSIAK